MLRTTLFTTLLISAGSLWALLPAQEEGLSKWQREYYDLDLSFAARVLMDNGDLIELSDFHVGRGLNRHRILTGNKSLYIGLRSVQRMVRTGSAPDRVTFVFDEESRLDTVWCNYQYQKLYGTLPDGGAWEGTIDQVREVEVFQAGGGGQETREDEPGGGRE
jgi:hypothetical protein